MTVQDRKEIGIMQLSSGIARFGQQHSRGGDVMPPQHIHHTSLFSALMATGLMATGLLVSGVCVSSTFAQDWAQFRGVQGRSYAGDQVAIPTEWTADQNVAWKAALPGRGPASPIVVGKRVFVTSSSGYHQDRLHVLCFDTESGGMQWERQFWATGRTMTHPSSANAAPTPASDGEAIYAFYSSNDLICLDLDGNLRWYRGLAYDHPKAGNDIGMSSSPVVADGVVVVQVENQGDSFVAAINAMTGATQWQIPRPARANWSSPVIARQPDGTPLVLVKSGTGLDAHDLQTGTLRWSFPVDAGGIPSLAIIPGKILLPANGLTALSMPSGSEPPEVRWESSRINPGPASPVVSDDKVYSVNRVGVVTCADLETGDLLWQLRLKGTFWATPVLAGDHLYCINDEGVAQVVGLKGEKGELVATNVFGEGIQGSPAVGTGALFVRSDQSLWKISTTK
jgi:outer membrane protein assembly factor BamB